MMRKLMMLGLLLSAAAVAPAADSIQPLNVKPGLWQVTTTTTIQGMGRPQTRTYQSCAKKEDMNKYPFADRENNCTYRVVSSTGTHMEVTGTCRPPDGSTADFKIQLDVIDSENAQGSGQLNIVSPQANLHGNYSGKGKWLAASCPAGVD
jgi:hypothetical protein